MEENNIMNNEEVIETTEEIVKATSGSGLKTATTIGLAMIAGALAYKFVVEPGMVKIKTWRRNRKATATVVFDKDDENVEDDDYGEDSEV